MIPWKFLYPGYVQGPIRRSSSRLPASDRRRKQGPSHRWIGRCNRLQVDHHRPGSRLGSPSDHIRPVATGWIHLCGPSHRAGELFRGHRQDRDRDVGKHCRRSRQHPPQLCPDLWQAGRAANGHPGRGARYHRRQPGLAGRAPGLLSQRDSAGTVQNTPPVALRARSDAAEPQAKGKA